MMEAFGGIALISVPAFWKKNKNGDHKTGVATVIAGMEGRRREAHRRGIPAKL